MLGRMRQRKKRKSPPAKRKKTKSRWTRLRSLSSKMMRMESKTMKTLREPYQGQLLDQAGRSRRSQFLWATESSFAMCALPSAEQVFVKGMQHIRFMVWLHC